MYPRTDRERFAFARQQAQKRRAAPPTFAEFKMAELFVRMRLNPNKVQREWPCRGYIVDFMLEDLKIALEVDGEYHESPIRLAKDDKKDLELIRNGYLVLRFSNQQVKNYPDDVSHAVIEAIHSRCSLKNRKSKQFFKSKVWDCIDVQDYLDRNTWKQKEKTMKAKLQALRPEKAEPKVDPNKLKPEVVFEYTNVESDKEQELNFLLKIGAPEVEMERKPLHLVATLDRSGSMSGNKLQFAKDSVIKMVEHLSDQDYFALFTFDHNVDKVNPSGYMTPDNKQRLIRAVHDIHCRGSTNLSGAYLEGLRCLRETEGKVGAIKRLILFTDGRPTNGVTNIAQFIELANKNKGTGVSVSTFGYGADHDPELMDSIANSNGGNFYFVEEPDECASAFATELGGLLSMFGQNLKLTFDEKENFGISVSTELNLDDNDRYNVNDVYAGEARMVTGTVTIPKHKKMPRAIAAIKGTVVYDNLLTGEQEQVAFTGKVKFVKAADADKEPNKEVAEQIAFDQAANAHQQAQLLAEQGNYVGAQNVMQVAASLVSADVADNLNLTGSFYQQTAYTSNRSMLRGMSSSLSSRRSHDENASWTVSNSSQDSTRASFAGGAEPADLVPDIYEAQNIIDAAAADPMMSIIGVATGGFDVGAEVRLDSEVDLEGDGILQAGAVGEILAGDRVQFDPSNWVNSPSVGALPVFELGSVCTWSGVRINGIPVENIGLPSGNSGNS